MFKSFPPDKEGIASKEFEVISQKLQVAPGEGAASCQVCGNIFRDGNSVIVYVFRTPSGEIYQIGQVVCGDGQHNLPQLWTLGVQEFLVAGEAGSKDDDTTGRSKLVLLNPEVLAESPPSSKSGSEPQGGEVR